MSLASRRSRLAATFALAVVALAPAAPPARAQNPLTDKKRPGEILVGLNLRDRKVFDMHRIDIATGREIETLARDPRCDVGGVMIHPETREVQAVGFNFLRNEWKVLGRSIEADFAALKRLNPGDFAVTSRDRADRLWIVTCTNSDHQVRWYLYDRGTKKATFLFGNQPALEKARLAKMEGVAIEARDGLALPCYLTLPVGVPAKNLRGRAEPFAEVEGSSAVVK